MAAFVFIMLLFLAIERLLLLNFISKGNTIINWKILKPRWKQLLNKIIPTYSACKTSATMHDKVYGGWDDKNCMIYSEKNADLLELQSNNFVEKQKNTVVLKLKVKSLKVKNNFFKTFDSFRPLRTYIKLKISFWKRRIRLVESIRCLVIFYNSVVFKQFVLW
jgi:hypothetical protein